MSIVVRFISMGFIVVAKIIEILEILNQLVVPFMPNFEYTSIMVTASFSFEDTLASAGIDFKEVGHIRQAFNLQIDALKACYLIHLQSLLHKEMPIPFRFHTLIHKAISDPMMILRH